MKNNLFIFIQKLKTILIILLTILFIVQACDSPRAYVKAVEDDLNNIKSKVVALYDKAKQNKVDVTLIIEINSIIEKMIRDEQARKKPSKEHLEQLKKLKAMFLRHSDYFQKNKINTVLVEELKRNILEAIRIILNTERSRLNLKGGK